MTLQEQITRKTENIIDLAFENYSQCSEVEKTICRAFAVRFDQELTLSEAIEYFRLLDIVGENGKRFNKTGLRDCIVDLVRKNIFMRYMCLNPSLQHQIALDALESPLRNNILKRLRDPKFQEESSTKKHGFYGLASLILEIYLLNDPSRSPTELEEATAKILSHEKFLEACPYFANQGIDPVWIENLPLTIRTKFLKIQLQEVWQSNEYGQNLQETINKFLPYLESPKEHPSITKIFLWHAIYTADLQHVRPSALEICDKEDCEELGLYASVKFLQGHFKEAYDTFNSAFAKLKSINDVPLKFTPISLLYYVLAALCSKPRDLSKSEKIVRLHHKLPVQYKKAFEAFQMLFSYLKTQQRPSLDDTPEYFDNSLPLINYAIQALCTYWIDRSTLALNFAHYAKVFLEARKHLPGIARILAEVLGAVIPPENESSALYKKTLENAAPPYSISFLGIIPVKEIWQESLDLLELFTARHIGNLEGHASVDTTQKLRMAWLVNPTNAEVIGPLEQKINAKGQWTKGRPIALERLVTNDDDFDYATAYDKQVIGTIYSYTFSSYGYYKKTEYDFKHNKSLVALIGHPHIINGENEQPIEFVKGEIELHVKEKDNSYHISLSAFPLELSTLVKAETNTRFQIIEFKEVHMALSKIIGPLNELIIPKESKTRLQTILKAIGNQMPVHSELNEGAVRKKANGTLHAHLTPLNQGMKINLFVRPFGADGPYFKPGNGCQAPQAMIKNKPERVLRNLAQERTNADKLILEIPSLYLNNIGSDEWIFDHPEEVLETLSHLQAYPEPIKLYWPNGQKFSVSSPVHAKSLSLRVKGDHDWFSLEGELKINEKMVIDLKSLLNLIDTGASRFVPIGDSQFLALTDHFQQLLCELKALSQVEKGKLKFHSLSASALSEIAESVPDFSSDDHWAKVKDRFQNAQKYQPIVPSTLQAELRPYQVEGFQWLSRLAHWGVGACLADDMGLGKTLQALALILEHASQGPTLVVAPMSVCHNWQREAMRFAPTLQILLHAENRQPERLSKLGPMQVLVTSYGLLNNECELLGDIKWQTIILDEAQVIKNINTKRSQAAMQLCGNVKVILTGTPLENRLSELWNLFRFINPGLLGSYDSFIKRFADPIEQRKDLAARQILKKVIQPFVLRRLKSQVLKELPPRIEKTMVIPFNVEEQAFYEALRRSALEKLQSASADEKSRIHILAEIMRLRRACCHPSLVSPEVALSGTKLHYFMELAEELRENNHRALVFSQFVGFLEQVRTQLDIKGISYQYLDGSTPMDQREQRVNAFQNGQGDFFLISLKAGGTGLNLTAADYVVHLDPWWNPAVEDQASDRAHRIGQTRPVTIYRIIMEGTIEEKMLKLHDSKRDLATDLLDGTNVSGKLSTEELLALLEDHK